MNWALSCQSAFKFDRLWPYTNVHSLSPFQVRNANHRLMEQRGNKAYADVSGRFCHAFYRELPSGVGLSRTRTEFHPHSAHRLHCGGRRRDGWRQCRVLPGRVAGWGNLGRGAHASATCRSRVRAGRHPAGGAGEHASPNPESAHEARSNRWKPGGERIEHTAVDEHCSAGRSTSGGRCFRRQSFRLMKRGQLIRRRRKRMRPRSPMRRRVTPHAASGRTELGDSGVYSPISLRLELTCLRSTIQGEDTAGIIASSARETTTRTEGLTTAKPRQVRVRNRGRRIASEMFLGCAF
jgi:hypothetical protein